MTRVFFVILYSYDGLFCMFLINIQNIILNFLSIPSTGIFVMYVNVPVLVCLFSKHDTGVSLPLHYDIKLKTTTIGTVTNTRTVTLLPELKFSFL